MSAPNNLLGADIFLTPTSRSRTLCHGRAGATITTWPPAVECAAQQLVEYTLAIEDKRSPVSSFVVVNVVTVPFPASLG